MSYTGKRVMKTAIAQQEIKLLRAGLNYAEVAKITGTKKDTLAERNRCFYKIDIWDAFRERIEREGFPNRLSITDDFGYWFVGFVDGEGHLGFNIYRRKMSRGIYAEYETIFSIALRDDDVAILRYIHDNLGVGSVNPVTDSPHRNPAVTYRVYANKDLAEVLIPLFDRYPLRTKKAKEYPVWREAIIRRYIFTLGGYSNRKATPESEHAILQELADRLRQIRAYS